jgi:hypothetical protein
VFRGLAPGGVWAVGAPRVGAALAEEPETPTLVTVGAVWALRGTVPTLAEEALGRISFRALREGIGCSPPRLAPARSRCRWVIGSLSLGVACP